MRQHRRRERTVRPAIRGLAVAVVAVLALSACEREEEDGTLTREDSDTMVMGADRSPGEMEGERAYPEGRAADRGRDEARERGMGTDEPIGDTVDVPRRGEVATGEERTERAREPLEMTMDQAQLEHLQSLIERTIEDLRAAQQLVQSARSASGAREGTTVRGGELEQRAGEAAEQPGQANGGEVHVGLTEFQIELEDSIPAGETTFVVRNDGTMEHNFEIEGPDLEESLEANLQPGEQGTLTVTLEPGTYHVYCPVEDHEDRGMSMELTVVPEDQPVGAERR